MNDRTLYACIVVSLLLHATAIPVVSLMLRSAPQAPVHIPIELVSLPVVEEIKVPKPPAPPPPAPKPKRPKITAPKPLSKPDIIETPAPSPAGNTKEEIKRPEKLVEPPPQLASLPPDSGSIQGGRNISERAGEAKGAAAGVGSLSGRGDVGVINGNELSSGGGGTGRAGLGRGAKGDGKGGGGFGSGDALSAVARPLGGYQVKPHYPESARRAGAQGVTMLKLRILENGEVDQVIIEQSAGHPDLDVAAAAAVKKWLFEPARKGKEAVSVWVLLPVKFELN